jgi:hypothetical protein
MVKNSRGRGSSVSSVSRKSKSNGIFNMSLNYVIIIAFVLVFAIIISNRQRIQENFFNNNNYSVEYYYMENCGHCIEFNKSGIWERLKNKNWNKVSLTKYNREDNIERVRSMDITSFPTIVIVNNTTNPPTIIASYEDERTYEKLVSFISSYD